MKAEEKLLAIFNHYGEAHQLDKLEEEAEEVIEATEDYKKDPSTATRRHLEDEIADVLVVISQLILATSVRESYVLTSFYFKIKRQLKRMEEENVGSRND